MPYASLNLLRELFPGQACIGMADAARVLGLVPKTVYNHACQGTLPFHVINLEGGKRPKVTLVALAEFLDGRPVDEGKKRGRPTKAQQIAKRQDLEGGTSCR